MSSVISSLKGKTILLTQNALHFISGSEIVLLELAVYFKSIGAQVIVFTYFLDEPMKSEFIKRHINTTTDEHDSRLTKADYVWVQHQVIPIVLLKHLHKLRHAPFFIFNHMSAIDDLYLEQPYIPNLEKTLASINVFVSEESMRTQTSKYPTVFKHPVLFPNPFPESFLKKTTPTKYIKKILVVSNHPPEELKTACQELTDETIEVDYLGKNSDSYTVIKPSILQQYDAIITIGKTVQYCLALNKPVFIYDHFGGCGYLNSKNYQIAKRNNFSGRGFKKKNVEQIKKEIVGNFYDAQTFQNNHYDQFIHDFSLQKNIANIFQSLPKRPPNPKLTNEDLNYFIAAETIAKDKIIAENRAVNYTTIINELKNYISDQEKQISILNQSIEQLNIINNATQNSRIVKLANFAHRAPKLLQKVKFRRTKHVVRSNLFDENYKVEYIIPPKTSKTYKIIGLIRERNESLILNDTLTELEKIVDGFILLDDYSDDSSIDIAKSHPKCLAIIKHLSLNGGDRSMEESIHREMLLQIAKKYSPDWLFYQDADERIDSPQSLCKYILAHLNDQNLSGIRLSLFDAYMTSNDNAPYENGELFNFRRFFGPERRDILFAWKNMPEITFMTAPDMREPANINEKKIITKFYVQHYGKSLSIKQWEETCDYYVKHFPQYAKKWQSRKGKAIHDKHSDFNRPLATWEELKQSGGIKIN